MRWPPADSPSPRPPNPESKQDRRFESPLLHQRVSANRRSPPSMTIGRERSRRRSSHRGSEGFGRLCQVDVGLLARLKIACLESQKRKLRCKGVTGWKLVVHEASGGSSRWETCQWKLRERRENYLGTWRLYLIAQDVNLADVGLDPVEAAKIIGGVPIAAPTSITLRSETCPVAAPDALIVVCS
jgi:hypothetical protein